MNRRIVVAIDAYISPQTQHVLRVASSLLEVSSPQLGVVLLHVIPVPDIPRSKLGVTKVTPTVGQRELAEQALHKARLELQKQGIVPERIELLLRSGAPPDEIVKAAQELEADFIMIASLPQMPGPHNLVEWYQEAIAHSLREHPEKLMIFTAPEVARMFAPPKSTTGRKEVAAASAALEQLARRGVLVCQKVNGEFRCFND